MAVLVGDLDPCPAWSLRGTAIQSIHLVAGLLISGPAGASEVTGRQGCASGSGNRAEHRRRLSKPYSSALLLLERGPDGRYSGKGRSLATTQPSTCGGPLSRGARSREIGIIATNSDGDPARRALLLSELGAGATERVIDPGEDIVRARLADPVTGNLSPDCGQAISRWYRRRTRGR